MAQCLINYLKNNKKQKNTPCFNVILTNIKRYPTRPVFGNTHKEVNLKTNLKGNLALVVFKVTKETTTLICSNKAGGNGAACFFFVNHLSLFRRLFIHFRHFELIKSYIILLRNNVVLRLTQPPINRLFIQQHTISTHIKAALLRRGTFCNHKDMDL